MLIFSHTDDALQLPFSPLLVSILFYSVRFSLCLLADNTASLPFPSRTATSVSGCIVAAGRGNVIRNVHRLSTQPGKMYSSNILVAFCR